MNPCKIYSLMQYKFFGIFAVVVAVCVSILPGAVQAQDAAKPATQLALQGKASLPIIIGAAASVETKKAAATLAEYLQKISGAKFIIKNGNGESGIAVGRAADFSRFADSFKSDDVTQREAYILRSHSQGVYLIGATDTGVEHAVWDLLHQLGYRYFFPGKHWEIIPSQVNLKVAVDKQEKPDFLLRDFFVGYNTWPDNLERWDDWRAANRMAQSFSLNSGHSWEKIISENKADFEAHPEYFALIKGERKISGGRRKFCLSNPGLRHIVERYALDFFAQNPDQDSVSIEPSDSGGWCECELCKAIGTPSDRMVFLANQVVDTVRAKYPGKYVAFYAYSEHAPLPQEKLHPGVIVSVTTALRSGNATFEELINGWRSKGAISGIRDYAGVSGYSAFGVPFYDRAGRVDDYMKALAGYVQLPDKFYRTELGDDWGPNGLGYYLATRILWDGDAVNHVDTLIDDFLEKSFGDAKVPMRRFYGLINGIGNTPVPPFDNNSIKQLYQVLDQAWNATADKSVRARLGDLVLYVHYLEKYHRFLNSSGSVQQKYFEDTLRYAYRIHPTHMVHSRSMYAKRFSNKLGGQGIIPKAAGINIPEEQNPWKSSEPFDESEIQKILSNGATLEVEEASLWKVSNVPGANQAAGGTLYLRGRNRILLAPLKDGMIRIMPTKVAMNLFNYPRNYSIKDASGKVVASGGMISNQPIEFEGKANQVYEFYVFASNLTGTYKLNISGAAAAIQTNLDQGRLHLFEDPTTLQVYVPAHLEQWTLELQTVTPGETAKVTVTDPNGRSAAVLETGKENVKKAILNGQEGFWKIEVDKASTGILYSILLTIDPNISPWASFDSVHPLKIESSRK